MATMNGVVEMVDRLKPNIYTDDDKFAWIRAVDGMIARRVLGEELPAQENPDAELVVPFPYDDVYHLYVYAMIDLHNREYNDYNNAVALFEKRLEQYQAWYVSQNPVGGARNFRNVMG